MMTLSPGLLARIAGALYLAIIVIGFVGQMVVRGSVVVAGDAGATASNLRAMEALWRAGIAAELIEMACAITLAVILYVLLRPVQAELALLAMVFILVSNVVEVVSKIFLYVALLAARRTESELTLLLINGHTAGFGIDLVFFGWACLILGYLIYRSGYIPRAIGVGYVVAGICYLVNSFALILSPSLEDAIFPAILLPAFVVELSFTLWLLIRGVDMAKWRASSMRA